MSVSDRLFMKRLTNEINKLYTCGFIKIKYKKCFKYFICLIQFRKNEFQFTQKANRFIAKPRR